MGSGWSIRLPGAWSRRPAEGGGTDLRAPGRSVLIQPGAEWRCADSVDIIAELDAELPPHPAGRVGEAGRDGIGHRAAWIYRDETGLALHGFTFVDGSYLETVFRAVDAADPAWAFEAWRSVARSDPGCG